MGFAFELQEELQALQDVSSYVIPNEHDIPSMSHQQVAALLEGAVESVADSSENIVDPQVLDVYRSFLRYADSLSGSFMSKMLDSISSGLAAQIETTVHDIEHEDAQTVAGHRTPIEVYAFLLQWFVSVAEKAKGGDDDEIPIAAPKGRKGKNAKSGTGRTAPGKKGTNNWSWENHISNVLALISKVLRLKTQRIWTTTTERDTLIGCLTRPAYYVMESEIHMKQQPVRLAVYKVICLAVKHHGHVLAAQTSILQSLTYYEHLAEPMAELLTVLAKEFDHAQLGDDILREVSRMSFSSTDTKGPRVFSRFLTHLAELSPRSVLKQISLLLGHLDSEVYPMRIAIVEVMGSLIRELAMSADLTADAQTTQKQIRGLYDLLLERTLDLSSYVRARVLQVLSRLLDLPVKFPKERLAATRAAIDALEDKAATVRKNAISLIVRLIVTHPYGLMHGGLLGLTEWQERYEKVVEELNKVEEKVGKVVERPKGEDSEDEGNSEEEADEEGHDSDGGEDDQGRKQKGKGTRSNDGEMEVDGEDGPEAGDDGDTEMADGTSSQPGSPRNETKKAKKKSRKSQIDMAALTDEQAALAALESNQILHLKLRKKYYAEALNFIKQIEDAMDQLGELLGSTSKLEVLEAMEFFRVAFEYQFDGAEKGIRKMLHLVWQKDNNATTEDGKELKGVRARLLECYRSLYFEPIPDMEPKQQVNRIAKNMIELTYDATLAELTSLEEMLRSMMEDEQIHQDVINKLWQVYSSEKQLPRSQRRGAIAVLGMLAIAKRGVVTDHVETLLRIGLGAYGRADLTLAKYTCVALQRLSGSAKKIKGSLINQNIRLEMDSPIFRKLQDIIEFPCRLKDWFPLAEQAINTIYALGAHPDVLCQQIIKNLAKRAFSPTRKDIPDTSSKGDSDEVADEDGEVMDQDPDASTISAAQPLSQQAPEGADLGDVFELSQLLFVVGHVAIKHVAFLELIEREWKRQKDVKEAAEKQAVGAATTKLKEGDELEQVTGNAEDEIGDTIHVVREKELLYGQHSLLALFGPMIVHICGSPHKFKNPTLRASAILAFAKFLCVSSQFCEAHHALLFKILETSRDPNVRANAVIALGDVAVSFGTIVDENSAELYKGLSDSNLIVKKNTLMVLTHLILNGMIKVKGQLGEMAKCVEDEDKRIEDLAKLFFKELSTKDNAIYNNLPDVISHLSVGEHAVSEEVFQSTMRYIFTFIEKERQAENIVEKLCQRFRLSDDPRQWRDIAFCLSLLPFKSERSVKKLTESIQFYRDKLHEPVVFERFQEILAKARSNKSSNKPDAELNEFEAMLDEHRKQGEDDNALERRAAAGKKAAAKKRVVTSRRATRKKANTGGGDSD